MEYGWNDSITPPPGFKLKYYIYAIINADLFSAFREKISEVINEEQTLVIIQLPPPQVTWASTVRPLVTTISQYYGKSFGRKFYRFHPSDSISTYSVTVNSRTVTDTGFTIALRYQDFEIPTYFKPNICI